MIYIVIAILLVAIAFLYFQFAERYMLIDRPNERSSHNRATIRGGGIVFPIGALMWFTFFGATYPYFVLGLSLVASISLADDRQTLSTKPRLAVHLVSVALMLGELRFDSYAWYYWLIGFVLIIGWLNAFNFMDGINGITAFYALSVLLPFWHLNHQLAFTQNSLLYTQGIGILIFAWFNARAKARTFAGDVGSISMAFILAFILVQLILQTGQWEFILFFAVYGVDAVLTIVHRLTKGENIFQAHRSHLYQYLANECGWPHLRVAALYAVLQLLVSLIIISFMNSAFFSSLALVLLTLLCLLYISAKHHVLRIISRQ